MNNNFKRPNSIEFATLIQDESAKKIILQKEHVVLEAFKKNCSNPQSLLDIKESSNLIYKRFRIINCLVDRWMELEMPKWNIEEKDYDTLNYKWLNLYSELHQKEIAFAKEILNNHVKTDSISCLSLSQCEEWFYIPLTTNCPHLFFAGGFRYICQHNDDYDINYFTSYASSKKPLTAFNYACWLFEAYLQRKNEWEAEIYQKFMRELWNVLTRKAVKCFMLIDTLQLFSSDGNTFTIMQFRGDLKSSISDKCQWMLALLPEELRKKLGSWDENRRWKKYGIQLLIESIVLD